MNDDDTSTIIVIVIIIAISIFMYFVYKDHTKREAECNKKGGIYRSFENQPSVCLKRDLFIE